jgi:NAD+ diphosphatase
MGGEQNQSLFAQSLSTLSAEEDSTLGTCPSNATLNSFNYPRTDPVVIMGVISPDGERLLLGRQKKWPQGFWSCLAGFIEPGESLEEAVRREVLEEAGVPLRDVVYHSSQSWPFPSQLMIGAIGIAAPHPKDTGDLSKLPEVRLDLDNELEGAEWYTREELLSVLEKSSKSHFTREDVKRIEDAQNAAGSGTQQKDEGSVANTDPNNIKDGFKIPPATAIAHVLIASWARGEAILPAGVGQKQLRQQQQANI